jgi:hypothetical protein
VRRSLKRMSCSCMRKKPVNANLNHAEDEHDDSKSKNNGRRYLRGSNAVDNPEELCELCDRASYSQNSRTKNIPTTLKMLLNLAIA